MNEKEGRLILSGNNEGSFIIDYNYTSSCETYGCYDEGICRCGTYEDFEVTPYTKEIVLGAVTEMRRTKDRSSYNEVSGTQFFDLIENLIYSAHYYEDDITTPQNIPQLDLRNSRDRTYQENNEIDKFVSASIVDLVESDIELFERIGLFNDNNYHYPEPEGDYYGEEIGYWMVSIDVKNFIIFMSIIKLKLNSSGLIKND